MKTTIHAPLVALLVAAACDTRGDDLDRELEILAEEAEEADDEIDEVPDGPDALQSEIDPAQGLALRVEFNGPCSDAAGREGVAAISVGRGGHVRGTVFDEAYPDQRIALMGSLSPNGSFEAVELAPFGECTWTGLVDTKKLTAYGAWDCGMGCDGDWAN